MKLFPSSAEDSRNNGSVVPQIIRPVSLLVAVEDLNKLSGYKEKERKIDLSQAVPLDSQTEVEPGASFEALTTPYIESDLWQILYNGLYIPSQEAEPIQARAVVPIGGRKLRQVFRDVKAHRKPHQPIQIYPRS